MNEGDPVGGLEKVAIHVAHGAEWLLTDPRRAARLTRRGVLAAGAVGVVTTVTPAVSLLARLAQIIDNDVQVIENGQFAFWPNEPTLRNIVFANFVPESKIGISRRALLQLQRRDGSGIGMKMAADRIALVPIFHSKTEEPTKFPMDHKEFIEYEAAYYNDHFGSHVVRGTISLDPIVDTVLKDNSWRHTSFNSEFYQRMTWELSLQGIATLNKLNSIGKSQDEGDFIDPAYSLIRSLSPVRLISLPGGRV